MNTRLGFATLSVTLMLLVLTFSQSDKGPHQTVPSHALPAMERIQASSDEAEQPLLLAGNTACNPRVTICEE